VQKIRARGLENRGVIVMEEKGFSSDVDAGCNCLFSIIFLVVPYQTQNYFLFMLPGQIIEHLLLVKQIH
jgi:hypothetical protein